ncbi:MAG: phosphate ABC transporter ATP-binding protein PstB [bacterium]|nr:phosphate ABC transporter ATP-binding protein PstB [bacterium]
MASKIELNNLTFYYGNFMALKDVNMNIVGNAITALIGPSGCGKSTLLRTINRTNELIDGTRLEGKVLIDGKDIYDAQIDIIELRKKVGMVFQRPNCFPLSVYDNVAYGPVVHGTKKKAELDKIVEESLIATWLWDDLKDKLKRSALSLSLDYQQRLCIARVLAIGSEIILLDEPCSALDPITTLRIEELLVSLKENYTIVIVTHNMQQAARVSDYSGYMLLGELVEFNQTSKIFTSPKDKRTEDYITGRFG